MKVRIASQRNVYYITYITKEDKVFERAVTPVCQVREIINVIEHNEGECLMVIKAGRYSEPEVVYSDGEWVTA